MSARYLLVDTFNRTRISRHNTIAGALKAQRRHASRVERGNGSGSYIPTAIRRNCPGGDDGEMPGRDLTNDNMAQLLGGQNG